MQKIYMVLVMVLSVGLLSADQGLVGIGKNNIQIHCVSLNDEHCTDIHGMIEEETDSLEEYEQHVCDNVVPAKISPMQAFLTSILGSVLIRAIIMKEVAHRYFSALKQMLSNWFGLNN